MCRRQRPPERRPAVGAVSERQDAEDGQESADTNAEGGYDLQVAVLPPRDDAPQPSACRVGVVVLSVHRDVSLSVVLVTRSIYQSDITLIDGRQAINPDRPTARIPSGSCSSTSDARCGITRPGRAV